MNTPSAPQGNWTWRYHPNALHPDFTTQLAALMEMTDRDGYEERAVLRARSELARIGHDIPLQDGETDGRSAGGFAWKVTITPFGSAAGGLLGHQVAVEVGWREGREERRIQLQTIRLGLADGNR